MLIDGSSRLENLTNIVCATILTGVYDVNRSELLVEDDFGGIEVWYDSILKLGLRGIVFHNTFSEKTIEKYQNKNISFVAVEYDKSLNANVFRYLVYEAFIQKYETEIANIFVTDISDVMVVQNPFIQSLFLENPDKLFCGDENETLSNEWMMAHSTHLRNLMSGFSEYEQLNLSQTLLNCGIIGGSIKTMKILMESIAHIHRTYTTTNTSAYTLDMGAFNYVARTRFGQNLLHGTPINTQFKKYESQRTDCWFRHK